MRATPNQLALRMTVVGLLVAWLWKYAYWSFALSLAARQPLADPFFPVLLQRSDVLFTALILPVLLAGPACLWPSFRALAASFTAFVLGSALLLLHQSSYNDASFVTSFWVALWGLWLLLQSRGHDRVAAAVLTERAAMLCQLLIGLLFLGGVVGKLTPGYLSGRVLHEIYFVERQHLPFALARELFRGAALLEVARLYSLLVLAAECALSTLPLWPSKPALWFAALAMSSICLLNNPQLFSVFAAPIAMCLVVLGMQRKGRATSDTHPESTLSTTTFSADYRPISALADFTAAQTTRTIDPSSEKNGAEHES